VENAINAKLFVGCHINGEVRMHLNESESWLQAKTQVSGKASPLVQAHFQQHDYIGRFCDNKCLSINELNEIESEVRSHLVEYCPKLDVNKLAMIVIPQVFIS